MKTKIGVISALNDELSGLVNFLRIEGKNFTVDEIGPRKFCSADLFIGGSTVSVTAVATGWGKVASAIGTSVLAAQYGVSEIVFFGVAGALTSTAGIGDIVIADELIQHDVDARPFVDRCRVPFNESALFSSDPKILSTLRQAADRASKFDSGGFSKRVLVGAIATGDQVFSTVEHASALVERHPNLLSVDMESAAVAQVCHDFDLPFGVCRMISDTVGKKSALRFGDLLKKHGAPILARVFFHYVHQRT